jgi:ComF family protein
MINRLLSILFPESCPVCKKPSTDHKTAPICSHCWRTISPYKGSICDTCGRPLLSDVSETCGECLQNKPAFKQARSFGLYEGTLKEALHYLKYYGVRRLAKPLSEIMRAMEIPQAHTMIPVPLYKKRLRKREFNHAALLARHLAKKTGIPVNLHTLIKIRDTAPQVGLSARERRRNNRNAFSVVNGQDIRDRNIVLVDDVFTTGATVRECARTLQRAGAGKIYVLLLAHSRGD